MSQDCAPQQQQQQQQQRQQSRRCAPPQGSLEAAEFNRSRISAAAATGARSQRRITIACDICNKRKVKCNGQHPCERCVKSGVDCVFAQERVRHIADRFSGVTVNGANHQKIAQVPATTPASAVATAPAAEHWQAVERNQALLGKELERASRDRPSITDPTAASNYSCCMPAWERDGGLPIPPNNGRPDGWSLFEPLAAKVNIVAEPPLDASQGSKENAMKPLAHGSNNCGDSALQLAIAELPELFFVNINAIAPINMFHHASIRQRIKEGTLPDYLLSTIRAVAAPYSSNPAIIKDSSLRYEAAKPFYAAARSALSRATLIEEEQSIELIQALLLLGWFSNLCGKLSAGWMLISMGTMMALDMRLTEDPDFGPAGERLPTWIDREVKRRTWWCAMLLDRYGSSWANRRPLLSDSAQGRSALNNVALPCDERVWHPLRNVENVGALRNNPGLRGPFYFRKELSHRRGEDGWKTPTVYKILVAVHFELIIDAFDALHKGRTEANDKNGAAGGKLPETFVKDVEHSTKELMELYASLPQWIKFDMDANTPLYLPEGAEGADWPDPSDVEWLNLFFRGVLISVHRPMMIQVLQDHVTGNQAPDQHPAYLTCIRAADESNELMRRVICRLPGGVQYLRRRIPFSATEHTVLSDLHETVAAPLYLVQYHPFAMCCNYQGALVHALTCHPSAGGPARSQKSIDCLRVHYRTYAAAGPFCVPAQWMMAALRRLVTKSGFPPEVLTQGVQDLDPVLEQRDPTKCGTKKRSMKTADRSYPAFSA
ncbi:hypothetical protein HDU86_007005 [Geranomyces michiganensis]|nr:hypothetical protein HDU86_007005 [Geranomyces michiganensis]